QAAILSPGLATLPSPVAPVRPNRRRSAVLVGVLLLLILVLVAGGSFGIWRVVTATAYTQANSTPTPTATPVPAGIVTEFPIHVPYVGGITKGPDGNLWFTENTNNQIGRITTSGIVTRFPLSPSSGPYGITAGPDGNLWFIGDANEIGRITTSGT